MSILLYIIIFTFIGSVASLIGGVFLLFNRNLVGKISHLLMSYAAGTLLGTAFFDLIPEALGDAKPLIVMFFTLIGFLSFFILARFIHWIHHHPHEPNEKPTVALITFGDSVHNLIDGVAIAASFLVSIPLGIITSFAVAAHEIPQEIGDFAVMLKRGLSPKRVLAFNFFSALTALVGALMAFYFANTAKVLLPVFISITAGFFLYISASDLIPEIHENNKRGFALLETIMIILGVVSIYILIALLEGF